MPPLALSDAQLTSSTGSRGRSHRLIAAPSWSLWRNGCRSRRQSAMELFTVSPSNVSAGSSLLPPPRIAVRRAEHGELLSLLQWRRGDHAHTAISTLMCGWGS